MNSSRNRRTTCDTNAKKKKKESHIQSEAFILVSLIKLFIELIKAICSSRCAIVERAPFPIIRISSHLHERMHTFITSEMRTRNFPTLLLYIWFIDDCKILNDGREMANKNFAININMKYKKWNCVQNAAMQCCTYYRQIADWRA